MCIVLLSLADELTIYRVLLFEAGGYGDGLFHLVAGDDPDALFSMISFHVNNSLFCRVSYLSLAQRGQS